MVPTRKQLAFCNNNLVTRSNFRKLQDLNSLIYKSCLLEKFNFFFMYLLLISWFLLHLIVLLSKQQLKSNHNKAFEICVCEIFSFQANTSSIISPYYGSSLYPIKVFQHSISKKLSWPSVRGFIFGTNTLVMTEVTF